MLTAVVIVLAVLAVLLVVVASRPADFRIARESAAIAAPPEVVFAQLNDFHRWSKWSPWEKLDPAMKKTFSGADAGAGAVYAWDGNKQAGAGRMTLTDSKPAERIAIKLEFFKPFAAQNDTEFLLEKAPAGVQVKWAMSGQRNFGMKAASLFMDLDKLVGGDFERGLAELKRVSEEEAARA